MFKFSWSWSNSDRCAPSCQLHPGRLCHLFYGLNGLHISRELHMIFKNSTTSPSTSFNPRKPHFLRHHAMIASFLFSGLKYIWDRAGLNIGRNGLQNKVQISGVNYAAILANSYSLGETRVATRMCMETTQLPGPGSSWAWLGPKPGPFKFQNIARAWNSFRLIYFVNIWWCYT